jgi:hypothetical protein
MDVEQGRDWSEDQDSGARSGPCLCMCQDCSGPSHTSQTRADIPTAALDVEARRIVLSIPGRYDLDINLSLSDADIQAQAKTAIAAVNAAQTMALKRNPKDLDVDGARAEWRVADGLLVLAC